MSCSLTLLLAALLLKDTASKVMSQHCILNYLIFLTAVLLLGYNGVDERPLKIPSMTQFNSAKRFFKNKIKK